MSDTSRSYPRYEQAALEGPWACMGGHVGVHGRTRSRAWEDPWASRGRAVAVHGRAREHAREGPWACNGRPVSMHGKARWNCIRGLASVSMRSFKAHISAISLHLQDRRFSIGNIYPRVAGPHTITLEHQVVTHCKKQQEPQNLVKYANFLKI